MALISPPVVFTVLPSTGGPGSHRLAGPQPPEHEKVSGDSGQSVPNQRPREHPLKSGEYLPCHQWCRSNGFQDPQQIGSHEPGTAGERPGLGNPHQSDTFWGSAISSGTTFETTPQSQPLSIASCKRIPRIKGVQCLPRLKKLSPTSRGSCAPIPFSHSPSV